jgi:FkbM family methyltransferase
MSGAGTTNGVSTNGAPHAGRAPIAARAQIAFSAALARNRRAGALARKLTAPARRSPMPVLRGNGRGLRVRFGASALIHIVSSTETEVENAFLGLLHPGDVVYDVGANIGWYSLLAAKRVGPAGKVVAFEPTPVNLAHISENAAGNGFRNVMTIPMAVTDRNGWATFLKKGSLEGRLDRDDTAAQAARRSAREHRHGATALVPVVALDTWIAETGHRPPDVLKIDVEGAEVGVLRGMAQTLQSAKPKLIIELHGTREEVADLLDSVGYQHTVIESDVPTRQAPWWAHVLAQSA